MGETVKLSVKQMLGWIALIFYCTSLVCRVLSNDIFIPRFEFLMQLSNFRKSGTLKNA